MIDKFIVKHLSTEVDFDHSPKQPNELGLEGPGAEIVIRLDVEFILGVDGQWARRKVNDMLEEMEQVIKSKARDGQV